MKELESLGLTSGEARAYKALLRLQESTVGPIVKDSKIAYSKIYDVLQRLIEKGLVSYILKEKTKHYQALPPSRLYDLIDRKEEELQRQRAKLSSTIGALSNLFGEDVEESAQIFIGEKGVLSAYEELLSLAKVNTKIRFFYSGKKKLTENVEKFYIKRPKFHRLLSQANKNKKITWQGITNDKKAIDPKVKYMKLKYVNKALPGNIDIIEDAILLISWSTNPVSVLVKSSQIAEDYIDYFDSCWQKA